MTMRMGLLTILIWRTVQNQKVQCFCIRQSVLCVSGAHLSIKCKLKLSALHLLMLVVGQSDAMDDGAETPDGEGKMHTV